MRWLSPPESDALGRMLGIKGTFLAELAQTVIAESEDGYPELRDRQELITRVLTQEEENFNRTIDQGLSMLSDIRTRMQNMKEKVLAGSEVFKLYDTYGFPIELTNEILAEHGFSADEGAFGELMEKQKEMARNARKSDDEVAWQDENIGFFNSGEATVFTGYAELTTEAKVAAMFADRNQGSSLSKGQEASVILDRTPFYAEMGGQVGDKGSELKIISPRNGSVFYYDESIPAGQQKLIVEASGGSADIARFFVDGKLLKESERPFIAQVSIQRGKQTIRVECGEEKREIAIEVR